MLSLMLLSKMSGIFKSLPGLLDSAPLSDETLYYTAVRTDALMAKRKV